MHIHFAKQNSSALVPEPPIHLIAKRNKWHRVYHGAYLDPRGKDLSKTPRETLHAASVIALAASTPVAVISHFSAAVMHGLPLLTSRIPARVQVTRATPSTGSKWAETHQAELRDHEHAVIDGVRCTSIPRTLRDLAGLVEPHELLALADAARARKVDLRPLRAVHRNRRILNWIVDHATDRSESFAESWSRYQLILAGIDVPLLQPSAYSDDGRFLGRADFGSQTGLFGEFDGKFKYDQLLKSAQTAADAVMHEKSRENDLRDTGVEIVRWDWRTLQTSGALAERWQRGLERMSRLPRPRAVIRLDALRPPPAPQWSDRLHWPTQV